MAKKSTAQTTLTLTTYFIYERRIKPNGDDSTVAVEKQSDLAVNDHILTRMGKLYDKGYTTITPSDYGFQAKHPSGYRVVLTCEDMFQESLLPKMTRDEIEAFTRSLAKEDVVQAEALKESGWDKTLSLPPSKTHEVPDGTYTVVFSNTDWMTLRVETSDWDKSGLRPDVKTKIEFLRGADNEADYTGFAFLDRTNGNRVTVWKRWQPNYAGSRLEQAVHGLLLDHQAAGETYALKSGRCWRCNRKLTVPASVLRGLGPDCAAKLGY